MLISHRIHNEYTDNKDIPRPSHTLSLEELGSITVKHNKTKDQKEVPAVNYLGVNWAVGLDDCNVQGVVFYCITVKVL